MVVTFWRIMLKEKSSCKKGLHIYRYYSIIFIEAQSQELPNSYILQHFTTIKNILEVILMQETFKNFSTLSHLYEGDKTLSETALKYQKDNNPIYLAHIFCKLYPYLKTQADKYFYLTDEDKVSFVLEELNKAVLAYDATKGAQVQTLVSTYVNNRLRTETQQLQHHKRCVNNTADSYDELVATCDDAEGSEDCFMNVLTELTLASAELSSTELQCCKIIMDEPHELKNTEIAEKMGITSAGVGYLKKKIATKLQSAF